MAGGPTRRLATTGCDPPRTRAFGSRGAGHRPPPVRRRCPRKDHAPKRSTAVAGVFPERRTANGSPGSRRIRAANKPRGKQESDSLRIAAFAASRVKTVMLRKSDGTRAADYRFSSSAAEGGFACHPSSSRWARRRSAAVLSSFPRCRLKGSKSLQNLVLQNRQSCRLVLRYRGFCWLSQGFCWLSQTEYRCPYQLAGSVASASLHIFPGTGTCTSSSCFGEFTPHSP